MTEEPETVELNKDAYTVTAEVADAQGITVTVKVPANTLPEGVNLVAEMLTEDTQAHADAEAALADAQVQYDGMIALDIRFEDAQGNEVEPANEVEVSIDAQALLPEDADPDTVAVQHLKEDATGAVAVETVANTDAATGDITVAENADQAALNMASTFAVDGFSSFTITWSDYFKVTVHYVDENGGNIEGTQTRGITISSGKTITFDTYAGNIEGYTFAEARYGSVNGDKVTKVTASQSGTILNRTRYLTFLNGNRQVAEIEDGRSIKTADVYLVYEADSQSTDPGVTSATVTTGKTLTLQEGQQAGGLYDLTLSVSGDRGSTQQKAMVDVLFVLDASNSMADSWGYQTRISAAKAAISQIMGRGNDVGLSDNENLDVQYALVGFGGGDSEWNDYYKDAAIEVSWTSDTEEVYNGIPNVYSSGWGSSNCYGGGTNYEAGFRTGKQALASSDRDGALKVVIFVSDGGPGYYYDNNGYTAGTSDPSDLYGGYDSTALQHAVDECSDLSADYFYFVGVTSNVTSTVFEKVTNAVPVYAGNKASISADDPDALLRAFANIEQNITFYACQDVTLTDTMSQYAEVVANEDGNYTFTINVKNGDAVEATQAVTLAAGETNKTVNLNGVGNVTLTFQNGTITLDFPDSYQLEEDHTYTVTTTVRPTDAATAAGADGYDGRGDAGTGTHAGQGGFYSNNNETSQVTFRPTVNNQAGEAQSEAFPKPVIQVFDPGDVEMETPAHTKQAILNDDGTYDLTLTVSGSTGTATKKAEVDVLMVVDVSNSMNSTRLTNTRAAMNALISQLEGNETVDARYSVVEFARYAETVYPWGENSGALTAAINGLKASGGTNYQAGLRKAIEQLENARPTATTVVVFLSDGQPTYYLKDDGTVGGSGTAGSIQITDDAWTENTLGEAQKLTCSQFYAVGISSTQAAFMENLRDNVKSSSPAQYFAADDNGSNLADKFKDIAGSVTKLSCEDVTITDTLSQYAEAVLGVDSQPEKLEVKVTDAHGADVTGTEVAAGDITASYDAESKTVRLDFDDAYQLKANYTYSVTLKIKPTDAALTEIARLNGAYPDTPDVGTGTHADNHEKGFFSNEGATLTYKITGFSDTYMVDYDKPVIQAEDTSDEYPVRFYLEGVRNNTGATNYAFVDDWAELDAVYSNGFVALPDANTCVYSDDLVVNNGTHKADDIITGDAGVRTWLNTNNANPVGLSVDSIKDALQALVDDDRLAIDATLVSVGGTTYTVQNVLDNPDDFELIYTQVAENTDVLQQYYRGNRLEDGRQQSYHVHLTVKYKPGDMTITKTFDGVDALPEDYALDIKLGNQLVKTLTLNNATYTSTTKTYT